MRLVNGMNQKEIEISDPSWSLQSLCFELIELNMEMLCPYAPNKENEYKFIHDEILKKERSPFENQNLSSELTEIADQPDHSRDYKSNIFRKPSYVFGFEKLVYSSSLQVSKNAKPRRLSLRNQKSSSNTSAGSFQFSRLNSNRGFLEQNLNLESPVDIFTSKEAPSQNQSFSKTDFNRIIDEQPQNISDNVSEFSVIVKNLKFLWTIPIKNGILFWWDHYIEPVDKKSPAEGFMNSISNSPLDTKHLFHFESSDNLGFEKTIPEEESKQYKKLYTIEFIQPQVSFVSQQAHGKIILASKYSTLELGAFDMSSIVTSLTDHSSLSSIPNDSLEESNLYKKAMSFCFKDAQLFVAPTGIDISQTSNWVDIELLSLSENVFNEKNATLLEKVTEPAEIVFKYTYDTEYLFKTLQSSSSLQVKRYLLRNFATVNCMSAGNIDDGNIATLSEYFRTPTSTTTLEFSPLTCCMNGRHFRTSLDVLNVFFIDPNENEAKTLYSDSAPSKDILLQKISSLVDGLVLSENTKSLNNMIIRKFEYSLKSVRLIMTDDIIASQEYETFNESRVETPGKFMEAILEDLTGSHSFLQDGSAEIDLKVRNLVLEDKLKQKQLLSPNLDSSIQKRSTYILQISANTRAPLCAPNEADSVSQFIACTTPYALFRVDLVPLTIDFAQDLYVILRRYFLSVQQENDANFIPDHLKEEKRQSNFFNRDSSKAKPASSKMFWMTRDKSDEKVKVPFRNYFEHLYISKVEICANFEGFVSFQNLKVAIEKFEADKKLWDWDKLVTRLEKHVYSNVISQASDIGKSLLGGIRKTIIKKANEMEQEDSKKDPSKFQDLKQSLLRKVAQASKKSPKESNAFDDE